MLQTYQFKHNQSTETIQSYLLLLVGLLAGLGRLKIEEKKIQY
jgi:hypothetical protein